VTTVEITADMLCHDSNVRHGNQQDDVPVHLGSLKTTVHRFVKDAPF
jgi:hypothetical protein